MILKAGTITADQDDFYKLAYKVQLVNHPAQGDFNGTARRFARWITINNNRASLVDNKFVLKGIKVAEGINAVDSKVDQTIYFKKAISFTFVSKLTEVPI